MPLFVLFASADPDLGADLPDTPPISSLEESGDSASIPPDHPAYDRVQTLSESDTVPRRISRRLVVGVLVVLALFVCAYFVFRSISERGNESPDLLTLAANSSEDVQLDVLTEDLDEAEDYILGEFGWPIRVPVLAESRLVGVGVDEVTDGVELPVLQYASGDSEPVTVYVYDYAFLDAAAGRLSIASPVYARLAEDDGVDVRRVDDYYVILWRRRAVIFTAITLADPALIVEGLRLGR